MINRYFEYISGSHYKFWEIIQDDKVVNVHYGRIGTKGQTQVKNFPSDWAARSHAEKIIQEKIGKGYVEKPGKVSGATAQAPLVMPQVMLVPKPVVHQPKPMLPSPGPVANTFQGQVRRRAIGRIKKKANEEE